MLRKTVMMASLAVSVAWLAGGGRPVELAKCVGAADCKACKTCKSCKHCHEDGGTCGKCQKR